MSDWCNHGDWSHRGECAAPVMGPLLPIEVRVRRAWARMQVEHAVASERALQRYGRLKHDRYALDRWADDGGAP